MKIGIATENHIPKLKKVFMECFEGTEIEYTDFFYDETFNNCKNFIIEKNDEVTSMMTVFNVKLSNLNNGSHEENLNGGYVYAVSTPKAHRKNGYMKQLFKYVENWAENENLDFLCLVPASDSLKEMYASIGYKKFSGLTYGEYTALEYNGDLEPKEISVSEYFESRNVFLKQQEWFIDFSDNNKYLQSEISFSECKCLLIGDWNVLYYEDENTLNIREIIGTKTVTTELFDCIGNFLNIKNIKYKCISELLPENKHNEKIYSMVKYLKTNCSEKNVYANLLLDE